MTMEAARLNLAIESVLEAEGGYRAPDDADPNPTNYGVTQASADMFWQKNPDHPNWPEDVRDLDRGEAIEFYEWYLTGCSPYHDICKVRPLILMVMLAHCQVLMGQSAGTRILQRAIGGIEADGMIGPRTIDALDRQTPQYVVLNMEDEWRAKYERIIEAKPEKAMFRDGWFARASGWAAGRKP